MEDILSEFEKRCKIDVCGPSLELEEIGDTGAEDKLASKTGTGTRYEAETGDEGNAKVYEGGEEDKLASKTGTGGEERSWERRKYAEVYDGGEEIEQERSQAAKAMTRSTTQLGGTTRSTAQVGDTTRSLPMLDTEQEGSQAAKATTRSTTQLGGTTRSTAQVGDATRSLLMIEDKGIETRSSSKTMEYLVENDVYTEKDFEEIQMLKTSMIVRKIFLTREKKTR